MRPVSEDVVLRALHDSPMRVRKVDGTVIIEPVCPFVLITLAQGPRCSGDKLEWQFYTQDKFYLIGREDDCPFRASIGANDLAIPDSRCFLLESRAELRHVLEETLHVRHSVENDFYVFPEIPEFLIYASHHDELLFYAFAGVSR